MNSCKSGKRNRRKQHGRAPSSHLPRARKQKNPPTDTSIEEQLRVQRKRRALESKSALRREQQQQQQQQQERQASLALPPALLGRYKFDSERNAYFPADYSFPDDKQQQRTKARLKQPPAARRAARTLVQCTSARTPLVPRATSYSSLTCATELATRSTRQHELRSLWATRLLRMGMQVVPTHSWSTDGSHLHSMLSFLKQRQETAVDNGTNETETATMTRRTTPLDLVCKTRLHPSARTFDVHMGPNNDPTRLPSIATLVDGGCHVWFAHQPHMWTTTTTTTEDAHEDHEESLRQQEQQQQQQDDANSLDIFPLADSGESEPHAIRFAPCSTIQNANKYAFCTICKVNGAAASSQQSQHQHESVVRLWCGNEDSIGHGNFYLPFDATDVAFVESPHEGTPTGIAVMGVARNCVGRGAARSGSRVVLMDIVHETFSDCSSGAPRSDALCIERHGEHLFCTGHRNGWLSLTDLRSSASATDSFASTDASAGSLTRIMTMKQNSNTILAKHSFGSCFLWDVRMMRRKGTRKSDNAVSVPLMHFQVPKGQIHPTKSSCCNGIALDPTRSFVLAPFVNIEERACLAFWSLSSGLFAGYNELQTPQQAGCSNNTMTEGMPYCELSNTITPAWKPLADSAQSGDLLAPQEDAGWGLWFKYGAPLANRHTRTSMGSSSATPNFLSSIHHVTFPGGSLADFES